MKFKVIAMRNKKYKETKKSINSTSESVSDTLPTAFHDGSDTISGKWNVSGAVPNVRGYLNHDAN